MAFKIKHVPSGLFYQPHKHRGNNLSKNGKIYATEGFAKSSLKSNRMKPSIQLDKDGRVHKIVKNMLSFRECKWTYNQVITETSESDWEIVPA